MRDIASWKELAEPMTRVTGSRIFAALVVLVAAYFGAFIYRTSFVVDGERYFSLFDDAMISMRYASHLASGQGLVWNPGDEPIEGFTNPLWTLYMVLPHLLPIAPSKRSLFIQITSAVLLLVNLYLVKLIAEEFSDRHAPVALAAATLTGFYLPINHWSLQGMEVGLLTLLVSVATLGAVRCLRSGTVPLWLYLVLGIGTLVRPDMVIPLGAVWLFLVITSATRVWRRHLLAGLLTFVISALGQTVFRLWYFHDILPNTYYLKMTGYPILLRVSRGAVVLVQFIWAMNPILFLLPLVLLSRASSAMLLLPCLLVVQMAYSVYVGGDAWEYFGGSNRYVSVVMPAFFVLFSCAAWRVSQLIGDRSTYAGLALPRVVRRAAFPGLIGLGLVSFNGLHGPASLADLFLLRAPLHSGPGGRNMQEVAESRLLGAITTQEASIAVTRAGTIPYYTERPAVDLLGKTDLHVAHAAARVPRGLRRFLAFRPGHNKLDYGYSVGQRHPDVVKQLWGDPRLATPYLDEGYAKVEVRGAVMWLKRDSPHILWPQVARLAADRAAVPTGH
jgi:hypothetical protein